MPPPVDPIFQPGQCLFPIQSHMEDPPERFNILSELIVESIVFNAKKAAFGAYRSYCHGNKRGPFEYFTYQQFGEDVAALARALASFGLKIGDRIGVWSYNRYEWHVLDYASNCLGLILVPLYDSQGLDSVKYVAHDSGIKMMFITMEILPKFHMLAGSWPESLSKVVVFDNRPDDRAFLLKHAKHLTAPYILNVPYTEEEINERNKDLNCYVPPDKSFYAALEDTIAAPSPSTTEKLGNGRWSYVPFPHIAPTLALADSDGAALCHNVDHGYSQLIARGRALLVKDIVGMRSISKEETTSEEVIRDESSDDLDLLFDPSMHVTLVSDLPPTDVSLPLTMEERAILTLPPIIDTLKPDDIFSLVYSSGTTGDPKGCVLTHSNLLYAVYQFIPVITQTKEEEFENNLSEKYRSKLLAGKKMTAVNIIDRMIKYLDVVSHIKRKKKNISQLCILSFLPSSHIFQRAVSMVVFARGGVMSFFGGSTKTLMDDLFFCRPTVFIGVPRVFQKIFDTVMKKLKHKPAILRFLFLRALNQNIKWKYEAKRLKIPSRYNFVFKDIQRLLGNRCKEIISGSAPLSPSVAEFVGCVMGCELVEGWGMTETCAAGIVQKCPCRSYANCGRPLGSISVKLVDVPELEYLSTDKPYPRGELCIKGGNIFSGYWKLPDKTKEVFDDEGYFHTGDIARFTDGVIQIIDRKKCVYKLSQGEFVSAEALERAYSSSPMVELSFMYGNRYESFVLAVVQVDEAEVRESLVSEEIMTKEEVDALEDKEALCHCKKVIGFVHKNIVMCCKEAKLRSFEIPRAVILEWEEWTVDNKCVTPSMKIRRPFLRS
ncbi:Long chain fatty acid CoA ligase 5, partial [Aduncisulcus paluster]